MSQANRVARSARDWLESIRTLDLPERVRIMNVCGGHERSITMAGLRAALPACIELIPGPGCPVCICPEEDVFEAIQLALNEDIILVAFGDMLRVPVNAPKKDARSLEQARALGAEAQWKQPVFTGGRVLHVLQHAAGVHGDRVIMRVDVANAIHPAHGQQYLPGRWQCATAQTRVAALGHDADAGLGAGTDKRIGA